MNPLVKIESSFPTQRLYCRSEMAKEEGIYVQVNCNTLRFVSNGQGEIFIFGDGCLLYKSMFADGLEQKYIKVKEEIVFRAQQ